MEYYKGCRANKGVLVSNDTDGKILGRLRHLLYKSCYNTITQYGDTIQRKNKYQCNYGKEKTICPSNKLIFTHK